jgi:hypothetical protein
LACFFVERGYIEETRLRAADAGGTTTHTPVGFVVPQPDGTIGMGYGSSTAQLIIAAGVAKLLSKLIFIVVSPSRAVLVDRLAIEGLGTFMFVQILWLGQTGKQDCCYRAYKPIRMWWTTGNIY